MTTETVSKKPTLNAAPEVQEPAPVEEVVAEVVAVVAPQSKVKLMLEENDNIPPTGLFVGDNGRGYLIRAGEEVEVPTGVLEILDNAKTSVPTIDPQSLQVIGYRDKMMYPYRVVR